MVWLSRAVVLNWFTAGNIRSSKQFYRVREYTELRICCKYDVYSFRVIEIWTEIMSATVTERKGDIINRLGFAFVTVCLYSRPRDLLLKKIQPISSFQIVHSARMLIEFEITGLEDKLFNWQFYNSVVWFSIPTNMWVEVILGWYFNLEHFSFLRITYFE